MNKTRYLPLVIIALLLSWLTFLLYKSQAIDTGLHTRTISSIQQLNHFDALLNQDILEVRYQSQLNMDVISNHAEQTLGHIAVMKELFTSQSLGVNLHFTETQALIAEKIHLIEQFKSHNGILRNSLRYLPGAVYEITGNNDRLHALDKLMEMLLVYNLSPEPLIKKRILLLLEQLSPADGAKEASYSHIIKHVRVALREHEIVSDYMHRLLELPTADFIARLYATYGSEYEVTIEDAATYRIFLFIFAMLLVLYVVYLFRQQNRMASTLRKTVLDLEFQKYAMDQHTIVAITDTGGKITYANKKFCEISHYSREELIGATHSIVNSGYHPKSFIADMWKTIREGKVWHGEFFNRAKNGETYWVQSSIVPCLDDQGKPFQYIAIRTDITDMKNAEQQLKREHELLERILSAIPSILIGVDEDDKVNLWNHAAALTFGIGRDEALGKTLMALNLSLDWDLLDAGFVESRNQGHAKLETFKFTHPDGSEGFLGMTMSEVHEMGSYAGTLLLASDITEKIKLTSQLQLSQKMEAIGELAAGVAHEVNTPLQYVGDNMRFLRDSFKEMRQLLDQYRQLKNHCDAQGLDAALIEKLDQAEEEADLEYLLDEIPVAIEQSLDGVDKAAGIISAMKEFSHPGIKEKSLIDINRAIENTVTVSRNEWKYIAEVETVLDEQLPMVQCFPEINQVFLNMIVNAAHAIEEKLGKGASEPGKITIRTSHSDAYVQVEIEDTGKGIAKDLQTRVFDPFYTTKEIGKGTGQGLSISHNIVVEKHGGTLKLTSEEGVGTTFVIRIPVKLPDQESTDE